MVAKCTNEGCDNNGVYRQMGPGGAPGDGTMRVCDAHYAGWLFRQMDKGDETAAFDGSLHYLPIRFIPNFTGDNELVPLIPTWLSEDGGFVADIVNGGESTIKSVESSLQDEISTSDPGKVGDIAGYVVIDPDAEGDSIMGFGELPEHIHNDAEMRT